MDVIWPAPFPLPVTSRVKPVLVKLALTVLSAFMLTVQIVPDTLVQPVQPPQLEPAFGLGVSVTLFPLA